MNSESRLSEPAPQPAIEEVTAIAVDGGATEEKEAGNGKGFFGRVLSALTGSESGADDDHQDRHVVGTPGLVNLRRMRVDDVAIPKVEIVAAPANLSLEDLVEMFREHGFSRMPVFRGTLDSPLGLIHLKDLALKHGFGAGGKFTMRPMLRPLLYVPPSMPIGVLLQQMQTKRIHMALVIDEYGGVDGLVTIEDLIEQVIGEIEDEHDEVEGGLWVHEKTGQWLIQARAALDDVEAETGLRLIGDEDEDIDTLGGLIFMLAGRVPLRGEVIAHPSGAEFEVVDADPRRLKRIRLRMPSISTPSDRKSAQS
ncbi:MULTISPECIES: hemolysin family protein [Paracoccus]|jgi:magnesium and cobalt transporter|uniref:HlyC/CorC family transporter n=2 Tax=Paracoccus TaxID=265 RepID=A0A5C4R497_9RHOB|nr:MULTISPECIES: hemolysin family protein [Paracoccus]TYP60550.1 magnesium and cobalt transporter [Stutzerimonas stutzeri]AZY94148.1 HlyC/CorC family transporter [Paracoccus sp. Arc7-R13]MCO6362564.1 CBS domain-containing protein [Paracoccus sp. 08]TNC05268.1 HlyC/CorC family transporter [Paracoccus marcusii]TNH38668.1 HlyC/CorC family transporter [Paracoccus haeundaensis]|tara:strand:- start:8197 stop:9126 length:930 start_codon:yes stop_codon:yes gene_type:complete